MGTHWWKYLIVAAATALAAFVTWRDLPPAEEIVVAEAMLRAPSDLTSGTGVGLYIENFRVALSGPDTTEAVVAAAHGLRPHEWREGLSVEREGNSAAIRVRFEHPDATVARVALNTGMRDVLKETNDVVLVRPRELLRIAEGDLAAAQRDADQFFAETGQFNPSGAYSNNISEIRSLDRQIREATLLRFSTGYINGLQAARDALAAELPTLAAQAQQHDLIRSRLEHERRGVYDAEERLTVAELDYAANRSPEVLILQEVSLTTRQLTTVLTQQVLAAAGVAFAASLLLVLVLGALLSLDLLWRRGEGAGVVAQPAGDDDGDRGSAVAALATTTNGDHGDRVFEGHNGDRPYLVEVE